MNAIHQHFPRWLQSDFNCPPARQRFPRGAVNFGKWLVSEKANFNRANYFLFVRRRNFSSGLSV